MNPPESFAGLPDLLSPAADSYSHKRKYTLTCAERPFIFMYVQRYCLFKHNLRTIDEEPCGIRPACCIIDKGLKNSLFYFLKLLPTESFALKHMVLTVNACQFSSEEFLNDTKHEESQLHRLCNESAAESLKSL